LLAPSFVHPFTTLSGNVRWRLLMPGTALAACRPSPIGARRQHDAETRISVARLVVGQARLAILIGSLLTVIGAQCSELSSLSSSDSLSSSGSLSFSLVPPA
jgi:hypothetical protein